MKLKVKSYNLTSYLERTFIFEPPLKKYGEIKHVENIGFNGGDYSAKIFSENGSELLDKAALKSIQASCPYQHGTGGYVQASVPIVYRLLN